MKLLLSFCSLLLNLTLPAQAAVMLIYHHVASDTPRVSSVSADELRGHLQYFKDNNFQVIGLDLLIKQLREGTPVADNAVVITFDDSYENNFTTAHPILQQFGYPYTIFISPGSIDKGDGPLLNWQQVKQMSDDGWMASVELRTPSLARWIGPSVNEWRFYAFSDVARLRLRDPLPEQESSFHLASVGIGTRLQVFDWLSLHADWAYPLTQGVNTERHDPRVHFSLRASF